MMSDCSDLVYGPVPSRRLGRSLGVNNIPPKHCTYSCVYCQIGHKAMHGPVRRDFFRPAEVAAAVAARLEMLQAAGEKIDYIALVPDGEPTLDANLGRLLRQLNPLGVKTAVISNASLIGDETVRQDLAEAAWVSLKVDSLDEAVWRRTDCPHRSILFEDVLRGIQAFASIYQGFLATETMLVKSLNDAESGLERLAGFIAGLPVAKAYISIPTRPPANRDVQIPAEETLIRAWHVFNKAGINAELLTGYEGSDFSCGVDFEADFLGIIAVHPMRADAVADLLAKTGRNWEDVDRLVRHDLVVKKTYQQHDFYIRRLPSGR